MEEFQWKSTGMRLKVGSWAVKVPKSESCDPMLPCGYGGVSVRHRPTTCAKPFPPRQRTYIGVIGAETGLGVILAVDEVVFREEEVVREGARRVSNTRLWGRRGWRKVEAVISQARGNELASLGFAGGTKRPTQGVNHLTPAVRVHEAIVADVGDNHVRELAAGSLA